MDSEDILTILIWGAVIFFSVVAELVKQKKKKAENAGDEPRPSRPKPKERPQPRRARPSAPKLWDEEPDWTPAAIVPLPAAAPSPRVQAAMPQWEQAPAVANKSLSEQAAMLPEEGQRVTRKPKKEEPKPIEATGLRNRENLKRAIIFGEILAPKF